MAEITRELLRVLRADINAALESVGAKHGVVIAAEGASFTATEAKFKLMVSGTAAPGETPRAARLANTLGVYKAMYPAIDFDAKYRNSRGETLTIEGYNSRARSMPFILAVEGEDKRYKCSEEQISFFRKLPA